MPKINFSKKFSKTLRISKTLTRLDKKKLKAKRKRQKIKQKVRLMALQLAKKNAKEDDKRISEDDCDFDFDNSTKPLCSTSEDDSDGPQG